MATLLMTAAEVKEIVDDVATYQVTFLPAAGTFVRATSRMTAPSSDTPVLVDCTPPDPDWTKHFPEQTQRSTSPDSAARARQVIFVPAEGLSFTPKVGQRADASGREWTILNVGEVILGEEVAGTPVVGLYMVLMES